ncbi:hypothetical protein VNO77_04762 [Canavalia gladiata]|uniref:Uncharacterized protein n=1 Tax=Canavalia gladiata TaxID=3824 RepID=A0AAN9R9D3_CANGL
MGRLPSNIIRRWRGDMIGGIRILDFVAAINGGGDTGDDSDGDDDNDVDADEYRMVSHIGGDGRSSFQVPSSSHGTSIQRRDQSAHDKDMQVLLLPTILTTSIEVGNE